MVDEPKKRRASKRIFFVVTDRDGMLEKHYSGADKARALETVEKVLQARANGGGREKGEPVSLIVAKAPVVFDASDLQMKLATGI